MEAWTRLRSTIFDRRLEVDFRPIIDCLRVALTLETEDNKLPLAMPQTTVPLADVDLLRHIRRMLDRPLPGMYPAPQRVQGSLIMTHIWEVTVDMSSDREAKALASKYYK